MPWTTADVDQHKKGLTDAQKEKWVGIANGALRNCEKKGGSRCDVHAIMIANAAFSLDSKTPHYALSSEIPRDLVLDQEALQATSEFQTVFPVGIFKTEKYGELNVTQAFCQAIVDNWKTKALGNAEPFLDVEHQLGEAQAWIDDMRATPRGLECKFNWTAPGKQKIQQKLYRYFSAYITAVTDLKSGKRIYPVLQAVALTNTPVMNVLPDVKLSNQPGEAPGNKKQIHGQGHGEKLQRGGPMDFEQLIAWLKDNKDKLTPEQLAALCEVLGVDAPAQEKAEGDPASMAGKKEVPPKTEPGAAPAAVTGEKPMADTQAYSKVLAKLEALELSNKTLTNLANGLATSKKNDEKAKLMELALSTGRITPAERPKWEVLFDKVPDDVEKLILALPMSKHLTVFGTGSRGAQAAPAADVEADAEARKLALSMGMSDKEYDETIKSDLYKRQMAE